MPTRREVGQTDEGERPREMPVPPMKTLAGCLAFHPSGERILTVKWVLSLALLNRSAQPASDPTIVDRLADLTKSNHPCTGPAGPSVFMVN